MFDYCKCVATIPRSVPDRSGGWLGVSRPTMVPWHNGLVQVAREGHPTRRSPASMSWIFGNQSHSDCSKMSYIR